MSFGRAASRLAITFHRPSFSNLASYTTRRNWDFLFQDRRTCLRSFSLSLPSAPSPDTRRTPDKKLAVIHAQIYNVLNSLDTSLPGQYPFNEEQILRVLGVLAASARPHDLALIEKILENFTCLCGLSVVAKVHDHIIRGLLKHGNLQTLLNWLTQMRQKPGNVQPFRQHWHAFLEHCADTGHVSMIRTAMSKMTYSGCPPDNRTFRILFEALFDSGATPKDFYKTFDMIEQYTFWYDETVADMLYEGFTKLNQLQQAQEVKQEFDRRFSQRVIRESPKLSEWEEDLQLEVERHGIISAIELCNALQREGYKVHHRTLSILLGRSHLISDLVHAERALNIRASPSHWSIVISNATRAGDLTTALSNYMQFRSTGLPLSAPLLQPLISALCDAAVREHDDDLIDRALELYRELALSFPRTSPAADLHYSNPSSTRGRSVGPDGYMYGTLLRAMGNSVDVQKYSDVAVSLLSEMEARQIPLNSSVILTSLIVLAVRCSSSVDDALEAYRRLAHRQNAPRITTQGYQWILHTLSRMSFGEDGIVPPIWHYFEIVKDMRLSGQAVTPVIYAQLLRRLSQLVPDVPEDMKDRLAACVRRVHDHLTLDPTITPDTLLWNQLMDSYQRVGLFAEAYRVWEMLLVSENYDHASASIILDACGFANAWPLARKVHARLAERSFLFNQGNWHSYVECMCRGGRLNEAVKIVCFDMGKGQKNVAPNKDTVRILLTFATRSNQQSEVLSRIQRYLPDLWQSLPCDLGGLVIKPAHITATRSSSVK